MKENQRQQISFFRYQVIAPLLNLGKEVSLQERFKELAKIEYKEPGSHYAKRFSAKTIEKWFYDYKKHGLDFLKPAKRSDRGESKTIQGEVATEVENMLLERPNLTGITVLKELEARGLITEGEISLSAFYRFRRGRKLTKEDINKPSHYRAYEFEYPQDCYQTDVMFGPNLATKKGIRKKTYLIAVIDDCTRVVTHGQFYFDQNLSSFVDTLKQAMAKRGIPKKLYLDNAQVFRSNHILRVTATLGIQLIHSRPYQPEGRAKVERFFRTVRAQFLSRLEPEKISDLKELNSLFWAWLEGEYHITKHRTLQETPRQKWLRLSDFAKSVPHHVDLDFVFLHQASRKVILDGTFQLDKQKFEVPSRFVGQKIDIHYNPDDLRHIYVSQEGKVTDIAYPVDLIGNSYVHREKEVLPIKINEKEKQSLVSLQHLRGKMEEENNDARNTEKN